MAVILFPKLEPLLFLSRSSSRVFPGRLSLQPRTLSPRAQGSVKVNTRDRNQICFWELELGRYMRLTKLIAIGEPDCLDHVVSYISQPRRPSCTVMWITIVFPSFFFFCNP
jgi:hypothetical protein